MADVKGPAETSQPKNTQTGCHGDLSGGCHGHLAGGYHGDLASGCHDDLAGGCRGDLAGDCRGDLAGGCRGDLAGSCHANHVDTDDGDANFELVLDLCKEFLQEKLNIESSYLLDMMYADGAISAREKESVDVLILLLLWIYTPCPCFFWTSWHNFGDIMLKLRISWQLSSPNISPNFKLYLERFLIKFMNLGHICHI